MNILVQNRQNLCFELTDLDVAVKKYTETLGVNYYHIKVSLQGQIWFINKRYSQFDKLNKRLRNDLESQGITLNGIPKLPPKKCLYNKKPSFLKARLRGLHNYLKNIILIYQAIENPILQRFLEIDIQYNPYFEYASIQVPQRRITYPQNSVGRRSISPNQNLSTKRPVSKSYNHNAIFGNEDDFGIQMAQIGHQFNSPQPSNRG